MSDNALLNFFAGLSYLEIFKVSFDISLFLVIFSGLLVQLIIRYAGWCYKIFSTVTGEDGYGEVVLKWLRKRAINRVFDWCLDQLDAYHPIRQIKNAGYGEGIPLFFSILLIILYPKDLLGDEWIGILVFSLLVVEKLWIIGYLKWMVSRANQLEIAGARCYQEYHLDEALRFYRQALSLYSNPRVSSNIVLNHDRAELLEQIAVILDNQHCFQEALINYNRVLTLYDKPPLLGDQTLNHTRARLLHRTAELFYRLGDRKNARKRYQLLSQYTGKKY
jgi:tetratricopeptide (TPR) repeat protein